MHDASSEAYGARPHLTMAAPDLAPLPTRCLASTRRSVIAKYRCKRTMMKDDTAFSLPHRPMCTQNRGHLMRRLAYALMIYARRIGHALGPAGHLIVFSAQNIPTCAQGRPPVGTCRNASSLHKYLPARGCLTSRAQGMASGSGDAKGSAANNTARLLNVIHRGINPEPAGCCFRRTTMGSGHV